MAKRQTDARTSAIRGSLPYCIAAAVAAGSPVSAFAHGAAASADASPLGQFMAKMASRAPVAARPAAQPALTTDIVVSSCADDGGFDTLRHAVLVANPGDTIDMSSLTCSKITLQSPGAISIGLDDLTIVGPGADNLTIDGADAGRVFFHAGMGTLTLNNLTVAHGTFAADKAFGGCIYSKANITLNSSVVTSCTAHGQSLSAGGGIIAFGALILHSSVLAGNTAITDVGADDALSATGGAAFSVENSRLVQSIVSGNSAHSAAGKVYGGGIATSGLTAKYSTITDNQAATLPPTLTNFGSGGGIAMASNSTIFASTIDNNTADASGGLGISDDGMTTTAITQSTISSNVGTLGIGALQAAGKITILNSTIAFNTSGPIVGVNVLFDSTAKVQGSIIADNSPTDADGGGAITGTNSLIKIIGSNITLPMGTLRVDPNLGPLANNGGLTRTHALNSGSPAINAGVASPAYPSDQRGTTYPRLAGSATDIGTYEVDTDHIFGTAFDYVYAF
ncbi:MAG TPA: choice-of-anchor Q domain-containing protein [Rudaea sp.]|jgi:hypothetical protein